MPWLLCISISVKQKMLVVATFVTRVRIAFGFVKSAAVDLVSRRRLAVIGGRSSNRIY